MRPLNLGETLDASIKIVRERWRTLALVMVVISLPIAIVDVLVISSTTDVYQAGTSSLAADSSSATTYSDEGAYIAGQTIVIALSFLGYLLGTVACYRAIADAYLGRPTGARETLSFAGTRLGATLWLTIVYAVGLILAFLALILPFFWLAVAWAVAYPVMLVEGTGGIGALKRSFKLVEDRWWATFGRVVVAYILVSVVTSVFSLAIIGLTGELMDDTSFGALVIEHAVQFLTSLVTTPFIAAVTTLVYFDLRVRKEGFDLALLAERMGGAPAAGPAGDAPPAPPAAPAPAPSSWGGASEDAAGRWSGRGEGDRDAFGNPVAPPGSWAPPVAPEPQRPPSQDE
jgi:Membrane domain of glycerophosphoryl diester phosphodiesterase